MKKQFYHGSINSNVTQLEPISKLHNTEKQVVYLTESPIYAMLYIWDSRHNFKKGKHITAWVKDGIVYYEEQFENQLKAFYDGVEGYLYKTVLDEQFFKADNSETIWYSEKSVQIGDCSKIYNVYAELELYIQSGDLIVIPFEKMPDERKRMLNDMIVNRIICEKLLLNCNSDESIFYKKFFSTAWKNAQIKNDLKLGHFNF